MSSYSDEECIALAMLYGCTFYAAPNAKDTWYVDDRLDPPYHPLEQYHHSRDPKFFEINGGWRSPGALARAYCEFYGLLTEDDHASVAQP